jgi:tetratricopeptide (TPR) repeat protein
VNSPLLRVQTSILTFLAAAFIGGCATLPERPQTPVSSPGSEVKSEARAPLLALAESWRHKAREFEKTGDLPKALKALEIVKTLSPEDLESGTRIADLKNQLPAAADRHFQKGLALFRNHSLTLARKEFLAAIYLKPDHAEALHFLKEKLPGEDSLSYEMKKGETLREVSQKIYGDPQKDFIIAYFNELKGDGPVDFPRSLKIPLLSPVPKKDSPPPPRVSSAPKTISRPRLGRALRKPGGLTGNIFTRKARL